MAVIFKSAVDDPSRIAKSKAAGAPRLGSRFAYLVAEIKIIMGTASELRGIATWQTVTRNFFNSAAFKAEHPDIYKKYLKTSIGRVFKLEK